MFWGFAFLLAGLGLLLQGLGYLPKDIEIFWPIVLIAIGLSMIFRRRGYDMFFWDETKRK